MLAVLAGTFLGDTFAHILGSLFGKTPLAPSVSPNKSIEGFVAGVAGGTAAVSSSWLAIVFDGAVGSSSGKLALFGLAYLRSRRCVETSL